MSSERKTAQADAAALEDAEHRAPHPHEPNREHGRLVATLQAAGLEWAEAGEVAREWVASRFTTRDAIAFAAAGVLRPGDTKGAPRFRDWTPPKRGGRK